MGPQMKPEPGKAGRLQGRKITTVRPLLKEESKALYWGGGCGYRRGIALELDGGEVVLIVSQDAEGNGPGALFAFGSDRSEKTWSF